MKFNYRRRRMPTVNIINLIDIFVILLIFVIVTTTFKQDQPEVDIHLPKTNVGVDVKVRKDPILLAIDKDGKIYLDGKPVDIDDLKNSLVKLVTESPDRTLALKADTDARFGVLIKVFGILTAAGVKQENIPAFTQKE